MYLKCLKYKNDIESGWGNSFEPMLRNKLNNSIKLDISMKSEPVMIHTYLLMYFLIPLPLLKDKIITDFSLLLK